MDATKQRGGLIPQSKDKRDLHLGSAFSLPSLDELPDEFVIPPFYIEDQKSNDFCSAATRGGMKGIMEKKIPFYPAIFALSKQLSDDKDDWGQSMRYAFKATRISVPMYEDAPDFLKKKLHEQDWDFLRDIENYPQEFIDSGKKYRDKSFFVVKSPGMDYYDAARASIWKFRKKKQTIAIGVVFSWQLEALKLTGTNDNGYGHMMYLNGWNNEGEMVVNSYGPNAGKNGTHLISRETINVFAERYGMMMGVDMEPETARRIIGKRKWLDASWWGKIMILLRKLYD